MHKYIYVSEITLSRILLIAFIMLFNACDGKATIAMSVSEKENADFEYRAVYSPSNSDRDIISEVKSHNIDYDWGIWGHNLHKVLGKNPDKRVFAVVNGEIDYEQYCFTSASLFKAVENYIYDNYGNGNNDSGSRFAIFPADNSIVCLCESCVKAGNNKESATPAVTTMVTKLAQRFPRHYFFTSSYMTTSIPPDRNMPLNTGVIISAIELPMSISFRDKIKGKEFGKHIENWKNKVDRIYIWDYMRNFDDYLTPYPCLGILRERLDFYKDKGVKGIIINGSGEDYSSFDDLQSYLISRLLIDTDIDIQSVSKKYLSKFYPVTADLLYDYYFSLEKRTEKGKILPVYGGINDAVEIYLNPSEFEEFIESLDRLSEKAKAPEKERIRKLVTALQFTRSELMRTPYVIYDKVREKVILDRLKSYILFDNMANYREANGSLKEYINVRENQPVYNNIKSNIIKGIIPKSHSGASKKEMKILTDGYYGLPTDYHTEWYITKKDRLKFDLPEGKSGKLKVVMGFMYAPKWNIILPEIIEIWQNDKKIGKADIWAESPEPYSRHDVNILLDMADTNQPIEIFFKARDGKKNTVACDEIEIFTF